MTQYRELTAEQHNALQRKSDRMKGIRYYLPRAYVAVKKRYPVAIETYLVAGNVNEQGVFRSYTLPAKLEQELGISTIQTPWTTLTQAPDPVGQSFGGKENTPDKPADPPASKDPPAKPGEPAPAEPGDKDKAEPSEKDSKAEGPGVSVTGGKAEFTSRIPGDIEPNLDVSDYYDIIYLPDYDEQYVMDVHGNLGKASMEAGLRYGWMLEGAQMSEDNTEIAKFVFAEIQEFTRMIRKAIQMKIAPEAAVADALGGGGTQPVAQSLDVPLASKAFAATIRIHVVQFANIGIHPLLKPGEIASSLGAGEVGTCHHALPVRYSCATEIYAEPLGARPTATNPPASGTAGAMPAPPSRPNSETSRIPGTATPPDNPAQEPKPGDGTGESRQPGDAPVEERRS